jgi:hypothetical protein
MRPREFITLFGISGEPRTVPGLELLESPGSVGGNQYFATTGCAQSNFQFSPAFTTLLRSRMS